MRFPKFLTPSSRFGTPPYARKRYGAGSSDTVSLFWRIFPVVLVLAFFLSPLAQAKNLCSVDRLISTAREKRLHEDRYWHILLHYEKTLFGVESQVDDPRFFVAENGKTEPQAELEATIRLLFGPEAEEGAVCRFYGRFGWLEEELGGAYPNCFAEKTCPDIDQIDPKAASLIFPTYYMNNPASMFGHTLLNIDTAYTNKRLSNAVNFAAYTEGNDGLMLAVNGLTGMFKGYYSVTPYYKKIQEYSDINQRDIWEYKLNLTREELRRMVRHIRELDQIYTDYYFFDENCSYSLLYLLEAARPTVRLTSQFHFAAIPIDTVKAVRKEGLISGVEYRPAKATRISHLIDIMDEIQVETVMGLIDGKVTPESIPESGLEREEKIRVLDLAGELLQYRFIKRNLDKADYREQLLGILRVRSRLGRSENNPEDSIPVPPYPEQGHESRRFGLGAGVKEGDVFWELRLRAALTDLTDMDYISHQGAQIEFGDLRGRFYPEKDRLALEQFDIIDIVSLSPVDAFFSSLSWMVNTGWHRKPLKDETDETLYYRLNGGAGYSIRRPYLGLGYVLAEAEGDISGKMDADYAIGGGGSIGTIIDVTPSWKLHLYGRALRFALGDTHTHYTAGAVSNFRISTNNHLMLEAGWEEIDPYDVFEIQATWHYFF